MMDSALVKIRVSRLPTFAATQKIDISGSLPTFAAFTYEINAKSEGERRLCGTYLPFKLLPY